MSTLATLHMDGNAELEKRIQSFLAGLGRQSLVRLQVKASGGVVLLTGHVNSFYERQLAISACHRVAGVYEVNDSIEVDP